MKLVIKSILVFALLISLFFSCVQKEDNELTLQENNLVASFSEAEKTFYHTANELDKFILENYNSLDFTLEEKMNILSDMIQEAYMDQNEVDFRSDEYVIVAQIFVDGIYTTDVRTSIGLPSSTIIAQALDFEDEITFAGANANVYLNGTNIAGNITNAQNKTCGDDRVKIKSTARLFTNGGTDTDPVIECD